jgi:hypothetical protein
MRGVQDLILHHSYNITDRFTFGKVSDFLDKQPPYSKIVYS